MAMIEPTSRMISGLLLKYLNGKGLGMLQTLNCSHWPAASVGAASALSAINECHEPVPGGAQVLELPVVAPIAPSDQASDLTKPHLPI
jgi:hypothetical protein